MEITVSQHELKKQLGRVHSVVSGKMVIPVLSHILFDATDGLKITGTDLDITVRCDVEGVEVRKQGAVATQAKKLFDIVRLLPNEEVSMKVDDQGWVRMKCGKSNFRLAGISSDQFPELPNAEAEKSVTVYTEALRDAFAHTGFAITTEQSRFTLSGCKVEIKGGAMKVVSTDAHRLALSEQVIDDTEAEFDWLVPKKAFQEAVKIESDSVEIAENENHLFFKSDGFLLIARKLTGTFPDYTMVLPKNANKTATADLTAVKKALSRVAIMANERTNAVVLKFHGNAIEIEAKSAEEGEAKEVVEAEYSDDEVSISYQSQYLMDFLNSRTEGDVTFSFADANSQSDIQMVEEGRNNHYVVMPLRS